MSDMPEAREPTVEEGRRAFDLVCQNRFGVSGEEFMACYERKQYPSHWTHNDIVATEILVPFWTEGEAS